MINVNDICKKIDMGEATAQEVEAFENLSAELNDKLNQNGGKLILSAEETTNGHYKALSPMCNDFDFSDKAVGCRVTRLNYWDDETYMKYQTEC